MGLASKPVPVRWVRCSDPPLITFLHAGNLFQGSRRRRQLLYFERRLFGVSARMDGELSQLDSWAMNKSFGEISSVWHRAGIRVRCERVAAILVFLYLLEGHPKGIAQITLTHSQFHALHPDHRTYFLINQTIAVARHGDVSLAAESESLLPIAPSLWSVSRIEALNGTC